MFYIHSTTEYEFRLINPFPPGAGTVFTYGPVPGHQCRQTSRIIVFTLRAERPKADT
jgi:hypothetical protein